MKQVVGEIHLSVLFIQENFSIRNRSYSLTLYSITLKAMLYHILLLFLFIVLYIYSIENVISCKFVIDFSYIQ